MLAPADYRSRPLEFCRDILGVPVHETMAEMLMSVRDHHNTAVKACHKSGKTFTAACLVHWWLLTRVDSVVITTAPTETLVQDLLWRDVRATYDNALVDGLYPSPPLTSEIHIGPKWYALGLTAKKENSGNFQGWHAPGGVLYIIDEAAAVDKMFFDAVERIAQDTSDRFLVMGNCPLDSDVAGTSFYSCFESGDFNCITIPTSRTPNVLAKKNVIPGMLEYETHLRYEREFPHDSPFYITRVLAQFLTTGMTGLIPLPWYEAAVERWNTLKAEGYTCSQRVRGADVAEEGSSESVSFLKEGRFVREPEVFQTPDVVAYAHHLERLAREDQVETTAVDANGIGSGTAATMQNDGFPVLAYKGSEGTDETDVTGNLRFTNVRSLAYWKLREALDPNNPESLALPEHPKLRKDLVGLKYKEVAGGKIQVEPKAEVIRRLGRSPDYGDALTITNYGASRGGAVAQMPEEYNRAAARRRRQPKDELEAVYGA